MKRLYGLGDIADDYDAILCDVWGVVHNGRGPFEAACTALTEFRNGGGRVCLITNAPVPSQQVLDYMHKINVPIDINDDCVSSGDATRAELSHYAGKKVWRIATEEGWEHDRFLYNGLDLEFVDRPEDADLGLLIGLRDQANDHPNDYKAELEAVAETGLKLICANPDLQVRIGNRLHWCAGSLGQIYETIGGDVIYPGKPHAPIYDLAIKRLNAVGRPLTKARTLAVGDGPKTDIRGAEAQGIDAVYVGTGLAVHSGDDAKFETEVKALLERYETSARYAQPALTWC